MKSSSIKKWTLGILVLVCIAVITTSCGMLSKIDHILGGKTEVVDTSQFETLSGTLAITNVSILSADSKSMLANQTVLIKDNVIELIGNNVSIPEHYHIIDGSGKYLIPGLIDSHVHIKRSKNDLLLYLANGITHVGEMTGMKEHFDYLKEIEDGALGPDIYIASPKVSSQKSMQATLRKWFEKRHQNYSTPNKARKAIRRYKKKGYKAIKLSSDLDRDTYYAITDEAKQLGIPVIGHLPMYVTLDDLFKSGQSQLAHITSITQAHMNAYGGISSKNAKRYLEHLNTEADMLAKKMKAQNITVSSTIWLNETLPMQDFGLVDFLKTIPLEYQNPGWLEGNSSFGGWLPGSNSYENPNNTDPESKHESEIYWSTFIEAMHVMTRALVNNDVHITVGTDAHGACGVVPGFSLHDEMESLSKVGMSNAQVLHAATLSSAQWFGSNSGIIKEGYRADMVLLNKNPLDDIRNTKTINSVIVKGNYLSRLTLDKMLKAVKTANNNSRKISIDAYLKD